MFALFFLLPLSPASVYAFAIALGLLWLSTVPPTNSIVAQIFGVRYLAMLSGFTFFSHQIGSFLGAWLGGRLYDTTGSYDVVWWISIALGVVAGLINLPIDEREIKRPATAARRRRRGDAWRSATRPRFWRKRSTAMRARRMLDAASCGLWARAAARGGSESAAM